MNSCRDYLVRRANGDEGGLERSMTAVTPGMCSFPARAHGIWFKRFMADAHRARRRITGACVTDQCRPIKTGANVQDATSGQ